MKSLIPICLIATFFLACQSSSPPDNLFNGHDLSGWHVDVPSMDTVKKKEESFIVREGLLISRGKPEGHLITDSTFQNFRLEVQYRFASTPGNCGVLVHVSTPRFLYAMFPKSIEVQLAHQQAGDFWCIGEDITVPAMEKRRGPKNKWGATEGKERRIVNLTDGSENPAGEWNTMIVECYKNTIKVWVNDIVVNEGTDCTAEKGQIAIQAEGSEVEFRKIAMSRINFLTQIMH